MHELGLAVELVEAAAEEARRQGDVTVATVYLRLGPLAGVVEQALLFAFDVAAAGTPVEGARLIIEQEPIVAWCATCETERTLTTPQLRQCPICGRPTPRLVSGDGMMLTAMEVIDHVRPDR